MKSHGLLYCEACGCFVSRDDDAARSIRDCAAAAAGGLVLTYMARGDHGDGPQRSVELSHACSPPPVRRA